jgi:hypothetical protein
MALTNPDKDWIRSAIDESHRLKGWASTAETIRKWSLPSVATALLIFFLVQWGTYTEFRTHTQDRLEHIESDMRILRAPIQPREILKEISRLDQKQFAQSLPALRKAQEQPVTDIKPLAPDLQMIAEKLKHTDPNAPEYWPTVLQFLHFSTAGISTGVPPPGTPFLFASHGGRGGLVLDHMTFKGMNLLLDGGSISDSTFENSRITFTENPVKLSNVVFINCVFDLPVSDNPNPYLKDAARTMLASSSLESIAFNNRS